MSTNVGSIHYDLSVDTSKFDAATHNINSKLATMGNSITDSAKKVSLGFMAIGAAATAFGYSSVKAYNESVEASTKLQTNMLNVKGATMGQVNELQNLAKHLQSVGVIQDDVIVSGMSQLATFNLQSSTIKALTPKITDMVAQLKGHNATAEDMVQINNLVGKVMTGNTGALGRYGVTLSDSQAKILQNGNEAERTAMLIEVLGQNYGKVNEALRNTPQGRITALKNSFNDFQELVGGTITAVFDPLVRRFESWIAKSGGVENIMNKLTQTIKSHMEQLKILGVFVGTVLVVAFGAWAVEVILATWPILAVAAAVAGLYALFQRFHPQIMMVINAFMQFWTMIQPIRDFIANQFKAAWEAIVDVFNRIRAALEPYMGQLRMLAMIIVGVVLAPIALFIGMIAAAIAIIAGIIFAVRNLIQWNVWLANSFVNMVQTALAWVGALPGRIAGAIGNLGGTLYNAGVNLVQGLANGIRDSAYRAINAAENIIRGLSNNVKKLLGIRSPSKVFYGIGENINQGLINGLNDSRNMIDTAINGMAAKTVSPMLNFNPAANGTTNRTTNNIYGNISLGDSGAVNTFFDHLNRNQELATMGLGVL